MDKDKLSGTGSSFHVPKITRMSYALKFPLLMQFYPKEN